MRLLRFPQALWRQRQLLWRLSEREVIGRDRGSVQGWGFLNPLLMLAVHSFVFSQVLQSRWGTGGHHGPLLFAINLFSGLIVCDHYCVGVTRVAFPIATLMG